MIEPDQHEPRPSVKRPRADADAEVNLSPIQLLSEWPYAVAAGLDKLNRLRLHKLLMRGMIFYTDYSGCECPCEALLKALTALMREEGWRFDKPALRWLRTCDHGALQTALLVRSAKAEEAETGKAPCHFSSILDRLPAWTRAWIEAATPPEDSSRDAKAVAYADIRRFIMKHRNVIFDEKATSWCVVHERRCPVAPLPRGTQPRPPLRCTVGGWTCVAWSTLGKSEGRSHESDIPLSVWLGERRAWAEQGAEEVWFGECVPNFDVQAIVNELDSTHDIKWLHDDPEAHGWPIKRKRLVVAGLSRGKVQWVGPEDYQDDYKRRFHRATMTSGDALFCASDADRNEMYKTMAQMQGHHMSIESIASLPPEDLLTKIFPPGVLQRLQEYSKFRRVNCPDDVFIADLDQGIHRGGSCGKPWPALLTHGWVMNLAGDGSFKLATGMEQMAER